MHPVRFRAQYTPTSVGALMDPVFLRRAINDMVTTTDTVEASRPRSMVRAWPARATALIAGLFAGLAAGL
jgi:hypothetical protein